MNDSINREIPEMDMESFADYIQRMIDQYHIKRIDISRSTGISQYYLYKVLDGTRRTIQRDYVIAICCAIGMNVSETQHALELSNMESLDFNDPRDKLIINSFEEGTTVYKLNDRLEKAGYPWLHVRRDMDEAA